MRDRDAIRAALEKAGVSGTVVETQRADHGVTLAEEAGKDGAQAVVAVGGDGTVNEVVNGLLRVPEARRPAFGVVPAGTGNDFAVLLGLRPGDLEGAARVLAAGATRVLDAGEVNGRFFANSVGLGFDGAVAETPRRSGLSQGFAAYLWSVFRVLRTWENFTLTSTVDGAPSTGRAILAAVGIGPRSGGGFHLTPDAKPDDGLFDVCRLGDFGKVEALRHLPKALDGSHVGSPKVTILRGRTSALASDRPLTAHVDGNLMTGRRIPTRSSSGCTRARCASSAPAARK